MTIKKLIKEIELDNESLYKSMNNYRSNNDDLPYEMKEISNRQIVEQTTIAYLNCYTRANNNFIDKLKKLETNPIKRIINLIIRRYPNETRW